MPSFKNDEKPNSELARKYISMCSQESDWDEIEILQKHSRKMKEVDKIIEEASQYVNYESKKSDSKFDEEILIKISANNIQEKAEKQVFASVWLYESLINNPKGSDEEQIKEVMETVITFVTTSRQVPSNNSIGDIRPNKNNDEEDDDNFGTATRVNNKTDDARQDSSRNTVNTDHPAENYNRQDIQEALEKDLQTALSKKTGEMAERAKEEHLEKIDLAETTGIDSENNLKKMYESLFSDILRTERYKDLAEELAYDSNVFPDETIQEWNQKKDVNLRDRIGYGLRKSGGKILEKSGSLWESSNESIHKLRKSDFGQGAEKALGVAAIIAIIYILVYIITGSKPPDFFY